MRIIAIAACALLLGAAPPPESADFVYTGTDDAQGGRLLMKSLGEISGNWRTEWLVEEKGAFVLNREADPEAGLKPALIVQVKMMPRGLDRIVLSAVFPGRPENEQDLKALQFLNRLNGRFTGMSFSYRDGGGAVAEAYHDFRNVVTGRDLQELLRDFDSVLDSVMEDRELWEQFTRFIATGDRRPGKDA